MPIYDNHAVFEIARGVKAFLSFRLGITRGEVRERVNEPTQDRELLQARNRVRKQQQTIETQRRRLARQQEQIAKKDRRISGLSHRISALQNRSSGREPVRDAESVIFNGVTLPPKTLRPCGENFRDDEFYLESAKRDAARLVELLGLSLESSLMDVGAGPGRLAIGIAQTVGEISKYRGVDVSEKMVRWGQERITPEHPNFQFLHIDVENRRYNPDGSGKDEDFTFPLADGEFDIITLYSVFTHMLTDGVRAYLKEFQRLLRPGGRIYLTAFLEENVPEVEENPEGYLGREWTGSLHCVRYNREFFERLLNENGFRMDGFDTIQGEFRSNILEQGQRGIYISKKAL